MRLIDADALPEYIHYILSAKEVVKAVENAPTIDAEPVKRGRWIGKDEDAWVCSFCGMKNCFAYVGHTLQDKYCPNCGAKMEEDNEANRRR